MVLPVGVFQEELNKIRAEGLYKEERVIRSPQGVEIRTLESGTVLNSCANNYLGLANHPAIVEAAARALQDHGFGMASVRFICGTQDLHHELENTIAGFFQADDAILYTSCFDANTGLFETILGPEDAVIGDALNHASIIDGIRLCKGPSGRGTAEHYGVMNEIDITTSTLGKAMGGASGGFTAGRKPIIDLLRQRSRPYLFSNTLTPALAAAGIRAFHLVSEAGGLRERLRENTRYFREEIARAGFEIKPGEHPIVPVMLYEADLAQKMAADLLREGIYVVGFFYPVVPKGEARIRVQISAAHEKRHLDEALGAFIRVGRRLGAIR
ncbi:MAG: aminotransferase class I/II-fold pyridoxal phosphate-dependent enzyme [Nitrospirae bacterium]|nr:aminotransferase class I/II-fold pyridoxal phosphate-dependent enzyme [Nitrospirota bacterium]